MTTQFAVVSVAYLMFVILICVDVFVLNDYSFLELKGAFFCFISANVYHYFLDVVMGTDQAVNGREV